MDAIINITKRELWNADAIRTNPTLFQYGFRAWRIATAGGLQYGPGGATEAEAWLGAARWLYHHTLNPEVRDALGGVWVGA